MASNGFLNLGTIDVLVATFHNFGTVAIPANTVVIPDPANPPTGDFAGGVIVPLTTSTIDGSFGGVTVESIPPGRSGPVRLMGVSVVTAAAAINYGQNVQASLTAGFLGQVAPCAAGTAQLGYALAPAAAGDILPIFHAPANNA